VAARQRGKRCARNGLGWASPRKRGKRPAVEERGSRPAADFQAEKVREGGYSFLFLFYFLF
jgi:hypothetical protein